MRASFLATILLVTLAVASAQQTTTYIGTTESPYSGFGKLRTYSVVNNTGLFPLEIGIEFTRGLLDLAESAGDHGRAINSTNKLQFFTLDLASLFSAANSRISGADGVLFFNGSSVAANPLGAGCSAEAMFSNDQAVVSNVTAANNVTAYLGRFPDASDIFLPFKTAVVSYFPNGHGPATEANNTFLFQKPHWDFTFMTLDLDTILTQLKPGYCDGPITLSDAECTALQLSENETLSGGNIVTIMSPITMTNSCTFDGPFQVDCLAAHNSLLAVPSSLKPNGYRQFNWPSAFLGDGLINGQSPILIDNTTDSGFYYYKYNGNLVGWDVIASQQRLYSFADQCSPIPSPPNFKFDGWYPKQYCLNYDETSETWRILLREFAFEKGIGNAKS